MSIIADVKNALYYLIKGEWGEFAFRLKVYRGEIDLKIDHPDELPTENTHPYGDSGGLKLKKVLNSLNITSQDSIMDFGSGKGGALITFSRYPFAKIAGVEISPELVAIAQKNLKKLKIRNVSMVIGDAAHFTDIGEYNYFYFANPFPAKIMRCVVENIETSLLKKPRKVIIIYGNPVFHNAIISNSSFEKIKEFHHSPLPFYIYSNIID